MRHFKKGLVTLITTAAVLAPAGLAGADEQNGLVNVYAEDILSGNQVVLLQNVSIPVAANVCGTQASVLSAALVQAQKVTCYAHTTSTQKAWVSYD